jgi:hypothetical protein
MDDQLHFLKTFRPNKVDFFDLIISEHPFEVPWNKIIHIRYVKVKGETVLYNYSHANLFLTSHANLMHQ